MIDIPTEEKYIETTFGKNHVIYCGDIKIPSLVLLQAAGCGSTIWYPKNVHNGLMKYIYVGCLLEDGVL
ncbi:hypothetical protein HMPREF9488_03094 [Coprobacillus cateniformis]|uniref:Uncharacterized protein n=1 Tax=Coprobacillus cateniformis TaxID=100884 RepID=E7GEA1_9FIRM|nr:hypothetical protein [Coprobacillus cateniformis]EFW03648.1 hypothetical protein HMPREF9488_03094 [Coprobacillus cateniformis]RGO07399.1 hypothetical protein DXB30_18565 [Coprobacillus cateniformis]